MKRMIVFDLDGTILNTLSDLKNALNYGLRKNQLKPASWAILKVLWVIESFIAQAPK